MESVVSSISQVAAKASPQPNYRLRRAVAGLVLAFFIALIVVMFQLQGAQATSAKTTSNFKYVSVHAGESLWTLAEKYGHGADPRDWIDRVVSLNQLNSIEVSAGQRIALP